MTQKNAIQVLDDAICKINAMRSVGIYSNNDIAIQGKTIKNIALIALQAVNANASIQSSLQTISFKSKYTEVFATQAFSYDELNRGLDQTYQNGLSAVIRLLEKEREAHQQTIQVQEQKASLMEQKRSNTIQIWTLIIAALSLIATGIMLIRSFMQ